MMTPACTIENVDGASFMVLVCVVGLIAEAAFFGYKFIVYDGLKIDANPHDLMAWYPEASASIKWGNPA